MKRFIPKLDRSEKRDYKIWSFLKLPHGERRPNKRHRSKSSGSMPPNGDTDRPKSVPPDQPAVPHVQTPKDPEDPEQFSDLVFSFFSSNDQHYVIHGKSPSDHYADIESRESPAYEEMNSRELHPKVHKSEISFYVNATSLKGSSESIQKTYDLPDNAIRSRSSFIVHHRCLNDETDKVKYQNSASLDNLSQICNASLHKAGSKRSIASVDRKRNRFALPNIAQAARSLKNSDYSSYFDNAKASKIKNRLSAIYTAHNPFKGKKRFSKAWYGIKEWFEAEKTKIDNAIHNGSRRQCGVTKSSDDYPDSDFSEYEDVEDASIDSFARDEDFDDQRSGTYEVAAKPVRSRSVCNGVFKVNPAGDGRASEEVGGSLRQSRSQPSVMLISEPILVKVNCESVDGASDDKFCEEESNFEFGDNGDTSSELQTTLAQQNTEQGRGGFAELKACMKEGSATCKELYGIMQQRAENERQYAANVLRIVARARRMSKGNKLATLMSQTMASEMENTAELHRQLSSQLIEDIVRPLQRLVATRDTIRKQIERDVGITTRRLNELRTREARNKKLSHAAARFNERIQDTSIPNGSNTVQEAEHRRKKIKSEEAAIKSDVEYYMACVRAERARVEWETAVKKCSETLVKLEEERLSAIRKALKRYSALILKLGSDTRHQETLNEENFELILKNERHFIKDLLLQSPPAMHLPDFYCQHITLAMNKERRKQALLRILELIKSDMERERRSKQALEKLAQAIVTTPNFGANDSQQNVSEKLYHMKSVLTYLEGTRIQAVGTLAVLMSQKKTSHPLSPHLKVTRDRRGLQHTILMVPPWLQFEYKDSNSRIMEDDNSPPSSPVSPMLTSISSDRGAADGVSIQHGSDNDDNPIEDIPERPPLPKYVKENLSNTTIVCTT